MKDAVTATIRDAEDTHTVTVELVLLAVPRSVFLESVLESPPFRVFGFIPILVLRNRARQTRTKSGPR